MFTGGRNRPSEYVLPPIVGACLLRNWVPVGTSGIQVIVNFLPTGVNTSAGKFKYSGVDKRRNSNWFTLMLSIVLTVGFTLTSLKNYILFLTNLEICVLIKNVL